MRERILLWIVKKLPKELVYWCAIIVWANATTGKNKYMKVDEVPILTALRMWEKTFKLF